MDRTPEQNGRLLARGPVSDDLRPPRDRRRGLQLGLAALWMLDGLLQLQPFFFEAGRSGFNGMLSENARGAPGWVAHTITWNASLVGHHAQLTNTAFAGIQILIGLGIAWRPTVRPALAASIGWALCVWWFGEGLGGLFRGGTAAPVAGGPGAALFYALVAVLLWPPRAETDVATTPGRARTFVAAGAVGRGGAVAIWLVTWFGLAALQLAVGRSPESLRPAIADIASGEPRWLGQLDVHTLDLVSHDGLGVAACVAFVFGVVGVCVLLPRAMAGAGVVLAVVAAAVIWMFGENFGMIFPGGATDPNSGPALALLALCFWPPAPASALLPSTEPVEVATAGVT